MKNSIERLKSEHALIERGLNLLTVAVARLDNGDTIPEGFPHWAARFFREFADQCHHAKEEDVLFPVLKQRGIPEEGGPIGVMLHEHVLGRDCVGRMHHASEGSTLNASEFNLAAKQYIPLLRQHIFKENNILFQMADRVMSDADDSAMTQQFLDVEQQRSLLGWEDKFSREMSDWELAFRGKE